MSAVASFILGVWILCSDMGWAGAFPLTQGFFSHWQIWMALGICTQLAAFRLSRGRAQIKSATVKQS